MQKVVYFGVKGFRGRYFTCTAYGTMEKAACAKNYAAAPDVHRTGRLSHCIGCDLGHKHANPGVRNAKAPIRPTSFAYREVCVRCRRGGGDTNRLIGRMRLVRDHTTCVSCYNREREVIKGRNSKGAMPKKTRLFDVHIGSVDAGQFTIEQFDHPVQDRLEAILTLMRRKQGPRVVAWTASRSIIRAAA